MSVREYIGARYVPVFASPLEWNASNTYEPLTIVLYQGNSYTSRQAVPAGIEITNTAYWAQTGNYNAQIEQYRQEVQALDTEIDNLLPVSVANGGTGATDAAGARAAIDAAQSNGATNTLYDAELAIAENAADIADLQSTAILMKEYATTVNLDNVRDPGFYYVRPSNAPNGAVNGWLIVMSVPNDSSSLTVKQIWLRLGTVNSNDGDTYIRTRANGTWGKWWKVSVS